MEIPSVNLALEHTFGSEIGSPIRKPDAVADAVAELIQGERRELLEEKMIQLRIGALPALHLRGCFPYSDLPEVPSRFAADPHEGWLAPARACLGVLRCVGLGAVGYASEASGSLFQHLTNRAIDGGLHDEKAVKAFRGHTDAVFHALPGEERPGISVSPDFVVLVGLLNPQAIPTRVYTISELLDAAGLSNAERAALEQEVFDVSPQRSFDLAREPETELALLRYNDRGLNFRFSNSQTNASSEWFPSAAGALNKLKRLLGDAPDKLIRRLVVAQGDIAIINNRTAIHGRDAPGRADDGNYRWLMRTYGLLDNTKPKYWSDRTKRILLP